MEKGNRQAHLSGSQTFLGRDPKSTVASKSPPHAEAKALFKNNFQNYVKLKKMKKFFVILKGLLTVALVACVI